MLVRAILRRVSGAALAALLACSAGCGGGTGQVEGKVVWADGAPAKELAGSQVVFESAATRTSARGTVGEDGSFRLGTKTTDDGAPVGDYQVALVEKRKSANAEGSALHPAILAAKYGDVSTSGLKVAVKPGTTPVTLTVERAGKQ